MPVFRLRERVLSLQAPAVPDFPCELQLNVELLPEVPFGGATGRTRNVVGGATVAGRANLTTARFSIELRKPLFDQLDKELEVDGGSFAIRGNIASITLTCPDEAALERVVDTALFTFPAVLSRYIPDVPYSTHAFGLLGDAPFKVHYEPTDVVASTTVTSKSHQEDIVTKAWSQAVMASGQPRLSMACQYFQTACRLLEVGYNRFEFTAEAILNFAKCLQALCGDSRDAARSSLRALGYDSPDLDGRFIPALLLRDQFDVAHIALSRLSRDELRVLHDYADIAEPAFRDLVGRALEGASDGTYDLPSTPFGGISAEKRKGLRRLSDNLAPFRPK
jgi:hypothetical protein